MYYIVILRWPVGSRRLHHEAKSMNMYIYEGRSKSNKTRVTAPFIKSVDKR